MTGDFNFISKLINELQISFTKSSGPGGQNVNKVSSKVEIKFDINSSLFLTPEQKEILLQKLANKLTSEGVLRVVSQSSRSQLQNKENAINKTIELIIKALTPVKKRKRTKPTRSSIENRLNDKRFRATKKADRQKPG